MTVSELNDLLSEYLGANPHGAGIFRWEWSNDLFWPASETGRKIGKKIMVPLIGGGEAEAEVLEPEYQTMRMCHQEEHRDSWVITKWFAPEVLMGEWHWTERFPGSTFPTRGWRIATNYYMKPGVLPFEEDTRWFIAQAKEQMSGLREQGRIAQWNDDFDRMSSQRSALARDMVGNEFSAWLNPTPGKRGGEVSPQTGIGDSPAFRATRDAWSKPLAVDLTTSMAAELNAVRDGTHPTLILEK